MKKIFYLMVLFTAICGYTSCNSEITTVQSPFSLTNKSVQSQKVNAAELISPQSKLLVAANKETQQTILKRMELDYHPTEDIREDLGTYMQEGTPLTDYSSVKFIPVITGPYTENDRKKKQILSICNDVAWMYGKTIEGENIYFMAEYTDWSKWEPNKKSQAYQYNVKMLGQAAVDSATQRKQKRTGAFCWEISYYYKGSIMFDIIEYAIQNSDDASFFVICYGPFHYCKICYFKNGKIYTCNKSRLESEISVNELWI